MASRDVDEIVVDMGAGREIHFGDLVKVCDHYFGKPRPERHEPPRLQDALAWGTLA